MKVQFNEAQLSRPQQQSLIKVLDDLQSQNEIELVVTPVEFPNKLKVKLDDDKEIVLGWDAEKKSYTSLTTPEPEPSSDDKFVEDHPIPIALDEPEPELDLSPVLERADALASAFFNLCKPLDSDRRLKLRVYFVTRLIHDRELLK